MAKRFTATEIWGEDWFLEMPNEYKLFWYYMLASCNHAGLFKINLRSFCGLNGVKISAAQALTYFNNGKQRIRAVSTTCWLIEDFFIYQYGKNLNVKNRVHESIVNQWLSFNIDLKSIRGLNVLNLGSNSPQDEDTEGVKDKDIPIVVDSKDRKEDRGMGKEEKEGKEGEENIGDSKFISPQMVKIFTTVHPKYPVDRNLDYAACREMAYKIAQVHGWTKEATTNGKMNEVLAEWRKIVDFTKNDKWFSKKSLSELNKQFQSVIQSIENGTHKQTPDNTGGKYRVGEKSDITIGKTIGFTTNPNPKSDK